MPSRLNLNPGTWHGQPIIQGIFSLNWRTKISFGLIFARFDKKCKSKDAHLGGSSKQELEVRLLNFCKLLKTLIIQLPFSIAPAIGFKGPDIAPVLPIGI